MSMSNRVTDVEGSWRRNGKSVIAMAAELIKWGLRNRYEKENIVQLILTSINEVSCRSEAVLKRVWMIV